MAAKQKLLVLYGTETGNSESISKRIHQDALALGYESAWHPLSDYTKLKLDDLSAWPADAPVIFVVSSTGDGDPPGNAEVFWRNFRKLSTPGGLSHVRFGMLGLGSSDYDSFQGFPNALYEKLTDLGAKECIARCKADDARGLETFVEPWIADLFPDLEQFCQSYYGAGKHQEQAPVAPVEVKPAPAAASAAPVAVAGSATSANGASAPVSNPNRKKVTPAGVVPKPPPAVSKLEIMEGHARSHALDYLTRHPKSKFHKEAPVSKSNPYLAPVKWARRITSPEAAKTVVFCALDMSGLVADEMPLLPGHAFGVLAPNPAPMVDALIERLKASPDFPSVGADHPLKLAAVEEKNADQVPRHLAPQTGGVCTLREALTWWFDLTSLPSKRFLAMLGNACVDQDDKNFLLHLASTRGKDDYALYYEQKRLNLLETLQEFGSCRPSIAYLLDTLPPMQPRYFSVANSQLAHPNEAHFMFVKVDLPLPDDRRFHGIATSWMCDSLIQNHLLPKAKLTSGLNFEQQMEQLSIISEVAPEPQPFFIPVFPRITEQSFQITENPETPIVMIGPGTGVSPFIGFLQHRRHLRDHSGAKLARAVLFYGCRHPEKDFLFHAELEQFVADGTLNQLITAFSRYHPDRVEYVQHRMEEEEHAKAIVDAMMNHNGIIYICGDARNMARGVRESILKILQLHGGMSETVAAETLSNWSKQKRYLLDVWA